MECPDGSPVLDADTAVQRSAIAFVPRNVWQRGNDSHAYCLE